MIETELVNSIKMLTDDIEINSHTGYGRNNTIMR